MLAKRCISNLRGLNRNLEAGHLEGALWENDRGFCTLGMSPANVLSAAHEMFHLSGIVSDSHSPFEQDLRPDISCRKQGTACPSAGYPSDRECGSSVAGR